MSALSTPFAAARLAAAQPLPAKLAPVIGVAVTPELIAGLAATLTAAAHDIAPAARMELECLLLQCRMVMFRRSLS